MHALLLAATLATGTFVENIPTRADATQTYTLYLPTSYDAKKAWPLLLVFDPRGRGTPAAEIFRGAAEEYGWMLISSNQTRSDDDSAPNDRAVRALLAEAAAYSVDVKRIYATGFSGTAMLAWDVGIQTRRFAGVIGVGGLTIGSGLLVFETRMALRGMAEETRFLLSKHKHEPSE
jgi:predicted peptidase